MKFSTILAVAAGTSVAQAVTISAAITSVSKSLTTFQNSLTKLTTGGTSVPQLLAAINVQRNADYLENNLTAAISAAQASKKLGDDASASLAQQVINLQPAIQKVLKAVVAKKAAFNKDGLDLTSTVVSDIKSQRAKTASLGSAITAKLSKAYAGAAPSIIKQIDGYFATALKAFS